MVVSQWLQRPGVLGGAYKQMHVKPAPCQPPPIHPQLSDATHFCLVGLIPQRLHWGNIRGRLCCASWVGLLGDMLLLYPTPEGLQSSPHSEKWAMLSFSSWVKLRHVVQGVLQGSSPQPCSLARYCPASASPQGLLLAQLDTRASPHHSISPLHNLCPNMQSHPLACPHPPFLLPTPIYLFLFFNRFSHIKIPSTHVVLQGSASQETNSICWELMDGNEFIQFISQVPYLNVDR